MTILRFGCVRACEIGTRGGQAGWRVIRGSPENAHWGLHPASSTAWIGAACFSGGFSVGKALKTKHLSLSLSPPGKNGFFAPFFFATFFLDPFFPDTFFFFGGITPRYHPTPTQPSCPALGCHTLGVSQALVQFSPFDFVDLSLDEKKTFI